MTKPETTERCRGTGFKTSKVGACLFHNTDLVCPGCPDCTQPKGGGSDGPIGVTEPASEQSGAGSTQPDLQSLSIPRHPPTDTAANALSVPDQSREWPKTIVVCLHCGEPGTEDGGFARYCSGGGEHGPTQTVAVIPESEAQAREEMRVGALRDQLGEAHDQHTALEDLASLLESDVSAEARHNVARELVDIAETLAALPERGIRSYDEIMAVHEAAEKAEAQLQETRERIEQALAILGTGECKVNPCEGCKADEAEVKAELRRALSNESEDS